MTNREVDFRNWHTSSHTREESCVEIGDGPSMTGVRDTKNREGGVLVFDHSVFTAFIAQIARGRFDLPRS